MAKKFTDYISKYRIIDNNQMEKIQYVFIVVLSEIEKIVLILSIFLILDKLKAFAIVFSVLIFVRHYVGGFHLKTFGGCLAITFCICYGTIMIADNFEIPFVSKICTYSVALILAYRFAPIPSDTRPPATILEKSKTNSKAVLSIAFISLIGRFISIESEEYIICVLLIIQIETIIKVLSLHGKRKGKNYGSRKHKTESISEIEYDYGGKCKEDCL